LYQIAVVENE
jgi:hypothetical protein